MANKKVGLPLVLDSRLRGLNMSAHQGSKEEFFLKNPKIVTCFNNHALKIGGGESITNLTTGCSGPYMILKINTANILAFP